MSQLSRFQRGAMVLLCLSPLSQAIAQTGTYNYGFCVGIAGTPPVNQVTRAFSRGPAATDLRAAFVQELGKKYGGEVRRDATGCRMFATASEAETAHDQVLAQVRGKPLVELDWLPPGASALSQATYPPKSKPLAPDSAAPHAPGER